jgi:hypothetical protein
MELALGLALDSLTRPPPLRPPLRPPRLPHARARRPGVLTGVCVCVGGMGRGGSAGGATRAAFSRGDTGNPRNNF